VGSNRCCWNTGGVSHAGTPYRQVGVGLTLRAWVWWAARVSFSNITRYPAHIHVYAPTPFEGHVLYHVIGTMMKNRVQLRTELVKAYLGILFWNCLGKPEGSHRCFPSIHLIPSSRSKLGTSGTSYAYGCSNLFAFNTFPHILQSSSVYSYILPLLKFSTSGTSWLRRMASSGILRRVALVWTDVSEELSAVCVGC
jgi:hypothetical protein